jgi:hypothetical protein
MLFVAHRNQLGRTHRPGLSSTRRP